MEESNIVTLTDENGNDIEFEVVASLDVEDTLYFVLEPKDESEEGVVIFKSVEVNEEEEEEILELVEDDDELDMVLEALQELMSESEMN